MISEYYEKTQNWDNESTTYWFKLTGIDYGTEMEFEGETYGIVESGCNDPFVVDSDNCSIPESDHLAIAVRNNVAITDEMRK
jgi:hypothetical protein